MSAGFRSITQCALKVQIDARWNGGIIGQGGPTNDQFVSLWTQLAQKYASNSKVVFGVMNEPHDGKTILKAAWKIVSQGRLLILKNAVPSITTWAATVQAVVTAIRNAGAKSQLILLPGNAYTSAQQFVSNGSLDALKAVKNPDGTTTNLIFDVHKYLDSDNSGTHVECTTNNVADTFTPLAASLRAINRQALLSETGGGNVQSCVTDLCAQIQYLK
ncbi:MAG: hypothetical protein Q9227_003417 [Pyrenula ochraceoflavens]